MRIFKLIITVIFSYLALLLKTGENATSAETLSTLTVDLYATAPVVLATESLFSEKIIEVGDKIPFDIKSIYDQDKDACLEDEIIQEGKIGRRTKEIKITYYNNEEYHREVIAVHTDKPIDEIIKKGLKKIYKSMETDSGTINYWCHLGTFTATAYDPTCPGCDDTTAIGLKAGFGVVAVDKKVIPLGSQLYITGYGKAIAGDTGGAIKGKRVDLGFDSIGSWWGKRPVEVYML